MTSDGAVSAFAGAVLRDHGTLFRDRFVVPDRRGDMGGRCVDRGNVAGP